MSFESAFDLVPLGNVASFINGDRSANYPKGDDYVADGIPFISAADLSDGRVQQTSVKRISSTAYSRLRSGKIQHRDVLFCLRGSIGKLAFVWPSETGAIASSLVIVRATEKVDARYLYFILCSQAGQQAAASLNNGSAQPNLSVGELQKVTIPLPPIGIQGAIAATLDAFDNRITLLRETNASLEAIAQTLFKSWFVDFDPVRAKMAGLAPEGMDEATAALFPDSLEETALGLVPKEWRIGRLDDLLVLQRGFDLPAQARTAGPYPIIAASGPSGSHQEAMVKGPGVVTGRSGVLGRVFLTFDDYWPLNTTLWIKEFRAATACFAYELLRLLDFKSFNAGSAVPTLNRNHIHGLPYVIPTTPCVEAFESIARPLHERVKRNEQHAQSLAELRDTLLPRLISGQLRLPEVPAHLEAA